MSTQCFYNSLSTKLLANKIYLVEDSAYNTFFGNCKQVIYLDVVGVVDNNIEDVRDNAFIYENVYICSH